MKKINKSQLIDIVSENGYINKKDARIAIDKTFEAIEKALLNGYEVNITNFGSFTSYDRKERVGTNPNTHEKMTLKSKKSVRFSLSPVIENKLNK